MSLLRSLIVCGLVLTATPAWPAEHPALARARELYNAGDFDGAIESAAMSRVQAPWAEASALVIARAHLERFRLRAQVSDLTAARETLVAVRADALSPRDQLDLLVGLGQSLFFGELFGAAAELFDTALSQGDLLEERDRRQLLDWWASALDRDAQLRPADVRTATFTRIVERMENELRQDPGCAPANYWLAASARGAGDADRAWNAAVAGWVRAFLAPATADALRSDLDRLVTLALIPERVRARPPAEQPISQTLFQEEWDLVKRLWK